VPKVAPKAENSDTYQYIKLMNRVSFLAERRRHFIIIPKNGFGLIAVRYVSGHSGGAFKLTSNKFF